MPRSSHDNQPAPSGLKRPSSPSIISTTASSIGGQQRPELRTKKSSNWFKRKSGMFTMNGDGFGLDAVDENQRPDTRDSKRIKESNPAPLLPEIAEFAGGSLDGGDIGWDEGIFKR
jgi:hypothetical protein